MPNQDKETVRRVLETVLAKLDGEPRGGEESAGSILSGEGTDSTSPLIVFISGLNSRAPDAAPHRQPVVAEPGAPGTTSHDKPGASHPGLERFPLAEKPPYPAAPKACFMEPSRTCVSSGACEMRGF